MSSNYKLGGKDMKTNEVNRTLQLPVTRVLIEGKHSVCCVSFHIDKRGKSLHLMMEPCPSKPYACVIDFSISPQYIPSISTVFIISR